MITGALAVTALKIGFGRARPDPAFAALVQEGLSFPSGHASMSAVFYLTMGVLLAQRHERLQIRAFLIGIAAFMTGSDRRDPCDAGRALGQRRARGLGLRRGLGCAVVLDRVRTCGTRGTPDPGGPPERARSAAHGTSVCAIAGLSSQRPSACLR